MIQAYFSEKNKQFYITEDEQAKCMSCETCEPTLILKTHCYRKKPQMQELFCFECRNKKKVSKGEYVETTIVNVVSELPVSSLPVIVNPELANGRFKDCFEASVQEEGVKVTDCTVWSFKNQCEQIDFKEHDLKLLNRDKELNKVLEDPADYLKQVQNAKPIIKESDLLGCDDVKQIENGGEQK